MKRLIPALFIILILSYFANATLYRIRYSLDCDSLIYADSSVIFDSTTSAKLYWNPATSEIRASISGYTLLRLGADTVTVDTLLYVEELTTTDLVTIGDTLITTNTFAWRLGFLNFNSGQTVILSELAVHPTNTNGLIFASCSAIPTEMFNANFVLDQITIYYTSVDSLDIFDFFLLRTDHDGTYTTDKTIDSIGYNLEGAQDSTMLTSDLTLADFAYTIELDVNGTDANTDVKFYEIEFKGHLEK